MTDEETKFIEALVHQIEKASQEKRQVLNDKLVRLDQRLVQEDLHISDLIETIIHRAKRREENTIEQLEELRSLVSHRVQIGPPPLPPADEETSQIASRFVRQQPLPAENFADQILKQANGRVN